jgi:hypothetical protein
MKAVHASMPRLTRSRHLAPAMMSSTSIQTVFPRSISAARSRSAANRLSSRA